MTIEQSATTPLHTLFKEKQSSETSWCQHHSHSLCNRPTWMMGTDSSILPHTTLFHHSRTLLYKIETSMRMHHVQTSYSLAAPRTPQISTLHNLGLGITKAFCLRHIHNGILRSQSQNHSPTPPPDTDYSTITHSFDTIWRNICVMYYWIWADNLPNVCLECAVESGWQDGGCSGMPCAQHTIC